MRGAGYIYYVKLKTEIGVFYKIGFTSKDSVYKRFKDNDSEDYKLIDEVFLFKYLPNSYSIENELHGMLYNKKAFPKYSRDPLFPLSSNGQTELYYEDVLSMDKNFSSRESKNTKLRVRKIEIGSIIQGVREKLRELSFDKLFESAFIISMIVVGWPLLLAFIVVAFAGYQYDKFVGRGDKLKSTNKQNKRIKAIVDLLVNSESLLKLKHKELRKKIYETNLTIEGISPILGMSIEDIIEDSESHGISYSKDDVMHEFDLECLISEVSGVYNEVPSN